ncbi:hypothetical protein A1A1_08724 [Planococcus antarcticus DSM 14505]|uniref:DUF3899 domain-containing protein n=1 Tax=Planococcus antarcticus DSM 14505 TaxID=1185653 RepID=A0A1C7DG12_9BACL|nr:hypothetical protein BBH88_08520 [Planococcus antarcticus DSM 14505]EIM06886.1 hypothetical protein A1A1_08724 [Planococcus antarcticus DSM 14505]
MKKFVFSIGIIQILIFTTIFFREENLSLLSYINNSFMYGGVLLFLGLWVFVVRTGVFDIFTISMRKAFRLKTTLENDEMRPPSEALGFSSSLLLVTGTVTLLLMVICLVIYGF